MQIAYVNPSDHKDRAAVNGLLKEVNKKGKTMTDVTKNVELVQVAPVVDPTKPVAPEAVQGEADLAEGPAK